MSIDFIKELNAFSLSVAVMVFFFLLEYLISLGLKKNYFKFSDTVTNTACGIIERGIYILFAFIYYGAFEYVYEHFRFFTIPSNWFTIAILFLAVDFLWYCYHRSGHVINLFWAAHITHHQSEEYNLTLSFRVSSIQLLIRIFFWMILPLLGFDPLITTVIIGINAAYQFFIHTRLINKLGFLEEVFVTPSHHRVHHGKNPQYIDKNYGGIFIIWDRLFGTFEREEEEVQYGITKALDSHNPFVAWFHYFIDLYNASKLEEGWKAKLKIFFSGPETLGKYYDLKGKSNYQPRLLSSHLKRYIGTQFGVLCGLCIMMFYWFGPDNYFGNTEIVGVIAIVSYSGVVFSLIFDNKSKVFYLELFRVVLSGAAISYSSIIFDQFILVAVGISFTLIYLVWLFRLKPELENTPSHNIILSEEKEGISSKKEKEEVFLRA